MTTKKDDFFELFKDRWKMVSEAEREQRQNEITDLEFEAGQHWDAKIKNDREAAGRPCLTIDLLSGPIKQVTNAQRTARPGIRITPVGGASDAKKAEYWQGIIRRVERLSNAGRVYSWAGQHQVKMGRGCWAVKTNYVGQGFEQDIRLEEIDNQHTVYCDPTAKKLDGSDKRWAIRWCDYTHEEYIERFGESDLADALDGQSWQTIGDAPPEWIGSQHVRVGEYYYLEPETYTKHLLSDGNEVKDSEIEYETGRDKGKFAKVPKLPEGVTIKASREVTRQRVKFCFINGMGEKIDETTIPGEFIPIVTIYGERRNINGKVDCRGLVRMAKDPSRMEDFCESSLMEAISTAKTAPWLAEWDQISEFKQIWENSNRVPVAVLPYKRVSSTSGAPIPPPQRVTAQVDVAALTMAAQRMQNHVRNTAGNADVFQEEARQEQSGRAIRERKMNQELGTSDFMENLGDGIVLTAKIIMSMARETLDTPRVLRIVGADEQDKPIVTYLGDDQQQIAQQQAAEHDIEEMFDLSGSPDDYDVAVSAGKRHDTARQETVDILTDLIPRLPPEMQAVAVPTLVKNIDGPGMAELAAKLEPQQDQKIPPQVQRELMMLRQQNQEMAQIIETDKVKQAAAVQVGRDRGMTTLLKTQMDNETKLAVAELGAKVDRIALFMEERARLGTQAHDAALAASDAGHEDFMSQQGHQQAMEQGEQGQSHAIEQAAVNGGQ